jgi:hypothetical protein
MAILSTDIKAWYDMANGSGTSVTDESGNGNTATLTTPDWSTSGLLSGSFTNLLDFVPANSDRLELNHQVNNQATFSVAMWVYLDTTAGAQRFIHNGNSDNAPHFTILNNAGTLLFRMYDSAGANYDVSDTISATTWTHVALAYNHAAGTFTAFKNGSSLGASSSFTVNTNWTGSEIYVGRREGTANQFLDGKVQQVITMNAKAIDATEASSIYNAGSGKTYSQYFAAAAGGQFMTLNRGFW